jgi:GNAT superfamily N-acetyltransferase
MRKRVLTDHFPPAPFDLPLAQFLAGREGRDLDVDRIFGHTVEEIIADYPSECLTRGSVSRAIAEPNYSFRRVETHTDHGIMLLAPTDEIVGAYLGCALAIVPAHRGHGLGAELVFEFALAFEQLPAWHLDVPAYTPAGLAAHCRAWLLGRDRNFVKSKFDVLPEAQPAARNAR